MCVSVKSVCVCFSAIHQKLKCNTLQHAATRCNTHLEEWEAHEQDEIETRKVADEWSQHTYSNETRIWTHLNTFNTLQHTATHCNALQHTATLCNTLWHTVTHLLKWETDEQKEIKTREVADDWCQHTYMNETHILTHCNTLQHTATHCNTLQRIYTNERQTNKTR